MKVTRAPSNRLLAIQILRCLAAMMVVMWHSQLSIKYFEHNYWPDGDALFRAVHSPFWVNHLNAGVDIFFCISGFIMSMLADRAKPINANSFVVARFARILPPYWLFTMVVISANIMISSNLLNVPIFTGDWGYDTLRIAKSLFLIPQDGSPILGVGWTLVHEMIFYYFIAILILFKQGKRAALFLAIVAIIGTILNIIGVPSILYGCWASTYYVEFFLGSLAYIIYKNKLFFYPLIQIISAIILYFVVSYLMDIYNNGSINGYGFGAMGFLLISGLIGLNAKYDLSVLYFPRLLARIGNASYSLYLSHWFVMSFLGKCAKVIPGMPVLFIITWQIAAIILSVFLSVIFAEHVELPFHKKLMNYIESRRKEARSIQIGRDGEATPPVTS